MNAHTCTHTRKHTRTHMHTHRHTQTHMLAQTQIYSNSLVSSTGNKATKIILSTNALLQISTCVYLNDDASDKPGVVN